MTDKQTPPDWVLLEAAKRSGIEGDVASLRRYYDYHSLAVNNSFVALCDMIERHEQPPVDRKLLCAREAITQSHDEKFRSNICHWEWIAIRAIELYEEGFGK
jgi:hypothetical protein